jgi:hypothetical protein
MAGVTAPVAGSTLRPAWTARVSMRLVSLTALQGLRAPQAPDIGAGTRARLDQAARAPMPRASGPA